MSYYYNYFIGYELDNKIYSYGPYDCFGNLKAVVSKSRSFASNLHEDFYDIKPECISDSLRKAFEYTDWNGEKKCDVKYLPIKYLPSTNYIKSGYFLTEDIIRYEATNDKYIFDGFDDSLTPTVYSLMLQKELIFGKPEKSENKEEDFEEFYQNRTASDYSYYIYPDYNSKEYESFLISNALSMMDDYVLPKEAQLVILETEG